MTEDKNGQFSFDFDEEPTQTPNFEETTSEVTSEETIIDDLFTENDLGRFRKRRKGWQENDISQNNSSVLRIENPFFGNDVNKKNLYHVEDWIDGMIDKMYNLNISTELENVVVKKNVNEWLFSTIVKARLNSRYVKKFMQAKLDVSIRVYSISIDMFEKVLPKMERLTKKNADELEREDFLNTEYLREVVKPLNSLELQYYQSFLNSLKPGVCQYSCRI
jgi:integrase/recombinase XerD